MSGDNDTAMELAKWAIEMSKETDTKEMSDVEKWWLGRFGKPLTGEHVEMSMSTLQEVWRAAQYAQEDKKHPCQFCGNVVNNVDPQTCFSCARKLLEIKVKGATSLDVLGEQLDELAKKIERVAKGADVLDVRTPARKRIDDAKKTAEKAVVQEMVERNRRAHDAAEERVADVKKTTDLAVEKISEWNKRVDMVQRVVPYPEPDST